ncbi:MAG: OST-HTH/LOTUS domain-containing protein [Paracoccaceae bacterium]
MTNAADSEKTHPVPDARSTRNDVEQLFGQCTLRFQAFELLMKAIVAQHRLSGSTAQPKDALTQQIDDTRRKTMGFLVGEMMTSFLVPEGKEGLSDETVELSGSSFTFLQQIVLSADEFARIEAEHRDLVALRNSLVHHFLEEHDLRSDAGCQGARQALLVTLDRVTRAHSDLSGFALDFVAARKAMADKLATPEVRDLIVSGRPPWPTTTIVQALRSASTALAACDWTSVDAAAEWIASHYPDEHPKDYGCRSWRQVIHNSGLFELQNRKEARRRHAWYRPNVQQPLQP